LRKSCPQNNPARELAVVQQRRTDLVYSQQLVGTEEFAIVAVVGDALNRGQPDLYATPCGGPLVGRDADGFAPAFDETRLLSWFACAAALSARETLRFRKGRVSLR
jgi:hypothetical protein